MEENHIKPKQVGGQARQEDQTAPPSPPTTPMNVGEENPQIGQHTPNTDKKKRKRKPLSRPEIWGIVLAIIGLVVTGVTGAAIVWQDIIASATLGQLHKSVQSDVYSNRAWIVPNPPPQNKANLAEATLEWYNAGRTPAVAVFSSPEYFVGIFPSRPKTCAEMEAELKKRPIGDWQYQAFVPTGGRYEIGLSHTPAWVGSAPILIHGCVWYRDVLTNTERTTEFFLTAFQNKFAYPPSQGVSLFYLADKPFIFK